MDTVVQKRKKVHKYESEEERIEAIRKNAREHYYKNKTVILEKQRKYKEDLRNKFKLLETFYNEKNNLII